MDITFKNVNIHIEISEKLVTRFCEEVNQIVK